MRVLFAVSDWPGHYLPMVPLGWALRSAGHEVRVLCAPSQRVTLENAGLTPVPLLGDMDMSFLARFVNLRSFAQGTWPYPGLPPLHPFTAEPLDSLDGFDFAGTAREIKLRVREETARSAAATVGLVRSWQPDLVVHDRLSMDGVIAAQAAKVPGITHLWGPVGTDEDDEVLYPLPVDHSGVFAEHGLPPMHPDLITHVIDPCPDALRPPTAARRIPVRYLPYNGPGAMEPWTLDRPAKPRICVIWSNSVTRAYGPGSYLVPEVLRALDGLDAEVVVPVHADDAAALGEVPASVRLLPQHPLHLLLPSCDLLIHHGGAGTTMTAVAAGTPQLALTFGAEQDADGERLAAAGAGLSLRGQHAGREAVRHAVTELLGNPSYRVAAGELARQNAARPTPADLVATLEDLATPDRTGRRDVPGRQR